MKPKILMVENELDDYQHAVEILSEVTSNTHEGAPDEAGSTASKFGIDEFLFLPVGGPATSKSQAASLLEDASQRETPFDILILDLEIPKDETLLGKVIGEKDCTQGLELLKLARALGAAREIIIYTEYTEYDNVLSALRGGAIDFVAKNIDDSKELPTRVLGCWQRILARDSASLLEQRIKDLIPYAEAGLAHRFTAYFSDFVQTVAHTAEDIAYYASERFGLDPEKDSQDYLFRCLRKQDIELKNAQENWAGLKADLLGGDEAPRRESLRTLLDSIHERLSACQLIKNIVIKRDFNGTGEADVLSFQDDVRVVLKEIITGTLSVLPDHGKKHSITITVEVRNGQAEVQFSDDLDENAEQRISPEDAQAINGGFVVGPDHGPMRFGRAWGLSVAQHIALRGGGRLIVKPQPSEGNIITYFIPLAR